MTCPTCGCTCSEQPAQGRDRYHLTAPDVAKIRAQIRRGRSDRDIAAEFGGGPHGGVEHPQPAFLEHGMSDHAETALDQLRLADSCSNDHQLTRADEHLGYLVKAVVHALFEVAAAVRETNLPPSLGPMSKQEMADLEWVWQRKYGDRDHG